MSTPNYSKPGAPLRQNCQTRDTLFMPQLLAMLMLLLLMLGSSTAFGAETTGFCNFSTSKQNLWVAGEAATIEKNLTLFEVPLSVDTKELTDNFRPVVNILGDDYGADIAAAVDAKVGMYFNLNASSGEVDVNYGGAVKFTYPDPRSFVKGATLTIKTDLDDRLKHIVTRSPRIVTDLYMAGYISLDAYFKFLLQGNEYPVFNLNFDSRTFASSDPQINPYYTINGVNGNMGFSLFNLDSGNATTPGNVNIFYPQSNNLLNGGYISHALPFPIPDSVTEKTNISGTLNLPHVELDDDFEKDKTNPSLLKASGEDLFIELVMDLDAWLPIPQQFEFLIRGEYKKDFMGIGYGASYDIFNVELGFNVSEIQEFEFTPVISTTLTFSSPLRVCVKDALVTIPPAQTDPCWLSNKSSITMRVGQNLHVVYPSGTGTPDSIAATPSFAITQSNFKNTTKLHFEEPLTFEFLKAEAHIDGFELVPQICIPEVSTEICFWDCWTVVIVPEVCTPRIGFDGLNYELGPAWDYTLSTDLQNQYLTVYTNDWSLGGFGPASVTDNASVFSIVSGNPPTAYDATLTVTEDQAKSSAFSATAILNNSQTFRVISQGQKGTVTIANPATSSFVYTPNANAYGSDTFTFKVHDNNPMIDTDSNLGTITVNITNTNDTPTDILLSRDIVAQSSTTGTAVGALSVVDVDLPDHDSHTFTLTDSAGGRFKIVGNELQVANGSLLNYASATQHTVPIKVTDASNATFTKSFVIKVKSIPVASNGTLSTTEDLLKNGTLVATDQDGETPTYSIVSNPSKGTVVITNAAAGAYTYAPAPNAIGTDTFTFRSTDTSGYQSNVASITVTISSLNDPIRDITINPVNNTRDYFDTLPTQFAGGTQSIASSGDYIISCTPDWSSLAAVIHKREDNGSSIKQTVETPAGGWAYKAGQSCSISGKYAVVGATGYVNYNTSGSVYVLKRDDVDGIWRIETELNPPVNTKIGGSVAISGDTIAVGNTGIGGGVLFYTRNSTSGAWDIIPQTVGSSTIYDPVVALSGNRAVVGTTRDSYDNHAYIIEKDGNGAWNLSATLSSGEGSDRFGNSVAISGDTIVIGAPDSYNVEARTGAAYEITRLNDDTWKSERLLAADGQHMDSFGSSVSASSNAIAIGAPNRDAQAQKDAGAVYIFTRDSDSQFKQTKQILPPTSEKVTTHFGFVVNLMDNSDDILSANDYFVPPESSYQHGYTVSFYYRTSIAPSLSVNEGLSHGATFETTPGGSVAGTVVGTIAPVDPDLDNPDPIGSYTFTLTDSAGGRFKIVGTELQVDNAGLLAFESATVHGIRIQAIDNNNNIFEKNFRIYVNNLNEAPKAADKSFTTLEDTPLSGALTGSDINGDSFTYKIISEPQKGSLTLNAATGAFSYTPSSNLNGQDSFTYKTNDGLHDSGLATATIQITPVNDKPFDVTTLAGSSMLNDPAGAAGDMFGASVAISGNHALVGAKNNSENATASGAAYFLEKGNDGLWQQTLKVKPGSQADEYAGTSVAISDSYALIGAYGHDKSGAADSGIAYLYKLNNGVWSYDVAFDPTQSQAGDYTGISVGISGSYAIAGASGASVNGAKSGAVYIMEHGATTWDTPVRLLPADGSAGDLFGTASAISGNYAIVGSPADADKGAYSGSAYLFERNATSGVWEQKGKLLASDGFAGDSFGASVAISGDYAVVGAPYHADNGMVKSGSAYLFKRDVAGIWSQVAKLVVADAAPGIEFGSSVSLSGDLVAVGAQKDGSKGSAHLFRRSADGTWSQVQKISAADGASGDGFGNAVALSGNTVLVGASLADAGATTDSGKVYVYLTGNSTVAESSPVDTVVGFLTALDFDNGDIFSFTLLDDADGRFKLNGNQILVANGIRLDYENAASHDIRVRATDSGGTSIEKVITILVSDVNEPPVSLDNSLMSHYPFIGSANDVSGNGRHGTVHDAPLTTDRFGVAEGAYSFSHDLNYVRKYISLPSFQIGGAFSIAAWVRNDNLNLDWQRLIDFGNGVPDNNIIVSWSGRKLIANVYDGSIGKPVVSLEEFPSGTWVHVAVSVYADGYLEMYWNGELKGKGTTNVPRALSRSQQYIGRSNWDSDPGFTGALDEIRLYDRPLSRVDVQNIMAAASCGSSNNVTLTVQPTTGLCVSGTPTPVTGIGPWNWSCSTPNSSASCSANFIYWGACGSANGMTLNSIQSADLCTYGTPSAVTGNGPWSWSCIGARAGNDAACSANSNSYPLTVTRSGNGTGTITVDTGSLAWSGRNQTGTYNAGTVVTLTVTPGINTEFLGWSGACSGTGSCTVTMDAAKYVNAALVNTSSGLMAYYPFDGNALDMSGNERHGKVFDASLTTDRFGNENRAYSFDGIKSYISLVPYPVNNHFTLSAWVYVNDNSINNQMLLDLSQDGMYLKYRVGINNQKMFAEFDDGAGTNRIESTDIFPQGEWVHVAVTDELRNRKIFWNGQLQANVNSNSACNIPGICNYDKLTRTYHYVGRSSVPADPYFGGKIDELRLYERALTDAEVLALYSVNGSCGVMDGKAVSSAPASYLCSSGNASAVTGSGPWSWTCLGVNGGANSATCSADVTNNGSCGVADNQTVDSIFTIDLCYGGTLSGLTGNGPWSWTCNGVNGGSNASCSADIKTYILAVNKVENGSGTVNVNTGTLAWSGNSGSALYNSGTIVTLTAVPDNGCAFAGWTGECSGSGTCQVSMNRVKEVTAKFINLNTGLLAYYPFNGNANDFSGNERHATVHGASLAVDQLGYADSAYSFDGNSNYISLPPFAIGSEFSVSAWVYLDNSSPDFQSLIDFANGQGDTISITWEGQRLVYRHKNGNSLYSMYQSKLWDYPIPQGQWVYLGVSVNGGTVWLTVNGVGVETGTGENVNNITRSNMYIGKSNRSDPYFGGKIDQLRLYGRALSVTEMQFLAKIDHNGPEVAASPAGGLYSSVKPVKVSLSCYDGTGGSSECDGIYYTTDGSTPTVNSTRYTNPLEISSRTALKYFAKDLTGNSGTVKTEMYFFDLMGGGIQKDMLTVEPAVVTTLAGLAGAADTIDAAGTSARFNGPAGITTDGVNLYTTGYSDHTVRKIVIATGQVSIIAGLANNPGWSDGTGTAAQFSNPWGITTDGTNLYVADTNDHTIRKIVIETGEVTTLAGLARNAGSEDGNGSAARFNQPRGISSDGVNLYVADSGNHTLRKIVLATGTVSTIAGTAGNYGSDDNTGPAARFNWPSGLTTDGTNLYVSDNGNQTIRKVVMSTNAVTTLAGAVEAAGSVDGTGAAARFYYPVGIVTDVVNLYVADAWSHAIRKIDIATGSVYTIAGTLGTAGSTDGTGWNARFNSPNNITSDGINLYVADQGNHTIRKIAAGPDTRTNGLIAHYPFNGNANDTSGNNYNGTPVGVSLTADREGNANSAYNFNGIDNYISIPSFTLGGEFSLSVWLNRNDSSTSWQRIIDFGNGQMDNNLLIGLVNQKLFVDVFWGDSSIHIEASDDVPQGQWTHVAATIGADGWVQLYLNGVMKGSGWGYYIPFFSRTYQYIGKSNWAGDSYLSTKMDDLRLYNRILSLQEVQTLYTFENGVCGSANQQKLTSIPVDNLCISGIASEVTGTGPWSWSCSAVSGGSDAACSANLAINQAITFNSATKTYGDFPLDLNTLATGGVSGNPLTFTLVSGPGLLSGANNEMLSILGAGNIVVRCSQAGNALYNVAPDIQQTIVVNRASATVTIGNLSQEFDGTQKVLSATTSPVGISVAVTYNGLNSAPSEPGSYAVVAAVIDGNYQGTATGTLVISKKHVAVTLGNLSQTYDGTARAVSVTTNPAGKTVTVTYGGSSTAPTNAGSYAVVATVVDTNYQGTATGTLVIDKAVATVTLGNLSTTYDGTPKSASYTVNPSGKTVVVTYNDRMSAPTDAGIYSVVATVDDTNYAGVTYGTMTIAKASATVSLSALNFTYDGSAKPVTAATTPAGLPVTVTYKGSTAVPVNAGSYAVTATVNDTNYGGTATGTLVIAKATAGISLGKLLVSYDGSQKTPVVFTDPANKTVTLTYNGLSTAPTAIGSYAVVATIDDSNYQGTASGTFEITGQPLILSFQAAPRLYYLVADIASFTASDNTAITGFCVTEANVSTGCSWNSTAPASYTFATAGQKTLYAFVRDADGNVSAPYGPVAMAVSSPYLTVNIATNGTLTSGIGGTVTSVPSGLSCSNTVKGTVVECVKGMSGTVNLYATPSILSRFGGWGGDVCSGTGSCIITMNADKSVTATFNQAALLHIGGTEYPTIQAAYDAAATASVIQLLATDTGTLTANRNVSVTLKGGYDASYNSTSGVTGIGKPMVIELGTIIVDGIAIK